MTAIEWVFKNSPHKGNPRWVLLALASDYSKDGSCLSISELSALTKLAETTVRRALDVLEKDGTITIAKNGGRAKSGGLTNCYRIVGFDTPGTQRDTPPINEVVTPDDTPGINEVIPPVAPGDTPLPFDELKSGTVEYVRGDAPEDKELLKELKEIQEIDEINTKNNQSNSLKLEDTRNTPSQTEDDLTRNFEAKTPELQAFASKAMVIATGHEDNIKPPGSGQPPLSQAVKDAYRDKFAFVPTDGEEKALERLVESYGESFIIEKIEAARLTDRDHKRIFNPAHYIETTLEDDNKPEAIWQKPPERRYQDRKPSNADKPKPREIDRWFMENAGG